MNQAKLKTYPMIMTFAKPGAVRLPNTLHEHFRADPRGATSFKQWRDDRIWELLQRYGQSDYSVNGELTGTRGGWLYELFAHAAKDRGSNPMLRITLKLFNGTIIKEWLPKTKESANVDKT